jgi:hypothetical protein
MTVRAMGLLLCSGLLALAATTGAFASEVAKGARAGSTFKIGDNNAPLPHDRKAQRQKAGPDTTKPNAGVEKRSRMSANEASASGALKTKRRARPGQSEAGFAPLRPAEFRR